MDQNVEHELRGVLRWAQSVRTAMERDPARRRELELQGRAYVGGVLTTLDHLGLVTDDEHAEWSRRLSDVLEAPEARADGRQ